MDFTLRFKQFAAALLLAAPFAVAAQAPSKPQAGLKEEDVQMSEEDLAKAKAEEEAMLRKKAAEDAAAERQAQREARMALCVIKPVMTDQEIDYCKVAYRN